MIKKIDKKNKFVSMFNPNTGFYMRSGVIENGKDTGVDPFMTSFPELLDIGVMCTVFMEQADYVLSLVFNVIRMV